MKADCAFEGCRRGAEVRGHCRSHYEQDRRGKPLTPLRFVFTDESVAERIRARSIPDETGCWIWQGARKGGYGQLSVEGRKIGAHVASYEAFIRQLRKGLEVDHRCRVRLCVNPEHLQQVTRAENNQNRSPLSGNRSGHRNVYWHSRSGRWQVCVIHSGRKHSGGYFSDVDEAAKAAVALRKELFTNSGDVWMKEAA